MDFSRDGKFLIIIGGTPDFNISIYDIQNGKFLITPDTVLQSKKDFISVRWNPRNNREFYILSKSKIQFYTLKEAFTFLGDNEQNENESEAGAHNFIDSWRFVVEEFNSSEIPDEGGSGPIVFTRAKWDAYNRVQMCTNLPKLFQICSKSPRVGESLDLHDVPVEIANTQKHLIVSHADGKMCWFKIEIPYEDFKPEDFFMKLFPKIEKEYNFGEQLPEDGFEAANFMHYSRSHKKILIGTSGGMLAQVKIPAEEKLEEEEKDDEED